MGIFDREKPVIAEHAESEKIHRYGDNVTIIGKKLASAEDMANFEAGDPVIVVRSGKNQESAPYQAESLRFQNSGLESIAIGSGLDDQAKDKQLAIMVPLLGAEAVPPRFAVEINSQGDLNRLMASDDLELEILSPDGRRYIFDPDSSAAQSGPGPTFEIIHPDGRTESKVIPLRRYHLDYGEKLIIRAPSGEKVRQIVAQLFRGTAGSGLELSQQLLDKEAAYDRSPVEFYATARHKELESSVQDWLAAIRADQQQWDQLAAEAGYRAETLQTLPESEISDSFRAGLIRAARLLQESPAETGDRLITTLTEIDRIGLPVGQGTPQQQAAYFQEVLSEQPDTDLISWAFDAKIKSNQPAAHDPSDLIADPWDYTPEFFPNQEKYEAWDEVLRKYRPGLRTIFQTAEMASRAVKKGPPSEPSDRQLRLLALSLRLGIKGEMPYTHVSGKILENEG